MLQIKQLILRFICTFIFKIPVSRHSQ